MPASPVPAIERRAAALALALLLAPGPAGAMTPNPCAAFTAAELLAVLDRNGLDRGAALGDGPGLEVQAKGHTLHLLAGGDGEVTALVLDPAGGDLGDGLRWVMQGLGVEAPLLSPGPGALVSGPYRWALSHTPDGRTRAELSMGDACGAWAADAPDAR